MVTPSPSNDIAQWHPAVAEYHYQWDDQHPWSEGLSASPDSVLPYHTSHTAVTHQLRGGAPHEQAVPEYINNHYVVGACRTALSMKYYGHLCAMKGMLLPFTSCWYN